MAVLKFTPKPIVDALKSKAAGELDFKNADYSALMAVWGNGNALLGFSIFYGLTMRLVHARTKHPRFAEGPYEALGVIGAEYKELEQAVEHESGFRQEEEAKDVIATCIRFLCSEHLKSIPETLLALKGTLQGTQP